MSFKAGQLLYHPESNRYAEAVEDAQREKVWVSGRVGKCGPYLNGRIYPIDVGLSLYNTIMDEVNFTGKRQSTEQRYTVSIRWLDKQWSDAAWDTSRFVAKHPLELLAECID